MDCGITRNITNPTTHIYVQRVKIYDITYRVVASVYTPGWAIQGDFQNFFSISCCFSMFLLIFSLFYSSFWSFGWVPRRPTRKGSIYVTDNLHIIIWPNVIALCYSKVARGIMFRKWFNLVTIIKWIGLYARWKVVNIVGPITTKSVAIWGFIWNEGFWSSHRNYTNWLNYNIQGL